MSAVVTPLGDQGLLIRLGDAISPALHGRVQTVMHALDRRRSARAPWIIELVPGYCSLLVQYDHELISAEAARHAIEALLAESDAGDDGAPVEPVAGRLVEIPVWYDPEVGPDLQPVAEMKGMSVSDVIARHSGREYLVYVLGFRPGFPFMGVLDDGLVVPRLEASRPAVAPGSVAIAGRQTAIYPSQSPGGWRVLGRTPTAIFDARRESPFALGPGDRVRFVPIDRAAFQSTLAALGDTRREGGHATRR